MKPENQTDKDEGLTALNKEVCEQIDKQTLSHIERVKGFTEEELINELRYYKRKYKKDAKLQFTKWILAKGDKEKAERINHIKAVMEAKKFNSELIITIEWKPSRIWRSNPKSYTNFGFQSESIGGCGYDKLSTATAKALNSDLRIIKLLYIAKNKALKTAKRKRNKDGSRLTTSDINRQFLGYGSGYNVLPTFEGGVGVGCHKDILKALGLDMQTITSTNDTDVFLIKKADKPTGRF